MNKPWSMSHLPRGEPLPHSDLRSKGSDAREEPRTGTSSFSKGPSLLEPLPGLGHRSWWVAVECDHHMKIF